MTQASAVDDFDLDYEEDGQPMLKCDIEINNEDGKTMREVLKSTAEALRKVADQIEANELDTGFHPIKSSTGEIIGEVYLDHLSRL